MRRVNASREPGPPRWTLGRFVVATVLAVTALVGATFYGFIEASRRTNAPAPVSDHSRAACAAALACVRSTGELYASPEWGDVATRPSAMA
jgi:hypothetical protein